MQNKRQKRIAQKHQRMKHIVKQLYHW